MQALDAWLQAPKEAQAEAVAAVLDLHADALAPPLGKTLGGVKLKKAQIKGLQELRNLFVCVRSEAARYGPDRFGAVLSIPLNIPLNIPLTIPLTIPLNIQLSERVGEYLTHRSSRFMLMSMALEPHLLRALKVW
jgi:hypothetical protein